MTSKHRKITTIVVSSLVFSLMCVPVGAQTLNQHAAIDTQATTPAAAAVDDKRSFPIILSLTLSLLAPEQKFDQEETSVLKMLLRDAQANSITVAESAKLPTREPLKVFVYSPKQSKVLADFQKWLEEWNRSDGGRYGRVESAPDASQAEIILARVIVPGMFHDLSNPTYSGTVEIDPATRQPATTPSLPVRSYRSVHI
jgi:hypothetical protein